MKITPRQKLLAAAFAIAVSATAASGQDSVQARIGKLSFEHGIPSKETMSKLYDEMDFQRATQAYIWATPAVYFNEWAVQMKKQLGVGYGDVAIWDNYCDPRTIGLTPNDTTIYAATHIDTGVGPVVIESPAGGLGMIDDIWQRPIADVGPFGPDKGMGGKFLILPPDYKGEVPKEGYFVLRSTSQVFGYLVRGLVKEGNVKAAVDNLHCIHIYPWSQRANPPATKFVSASGVPLNLLAPTGFEYWERVAEIVNREPVDERDRFILAQLRFLGIEKGQPFHPDARQKALLTEAAVVGHAMCQSISFGSRLPASEYLKGSKWELLMTLNPDQRTANYDQIDERANYTYQGIWVANGMVVQMEGKGSQYLGAAQDKDGNWLVGDNSYSLHIPPNVPAKDFWSVTLYDSLTRSQIVTDTLKPSVGSNLPLLVSPDGSVDLYFSPVAQAGKEKNWVKTSPGKAWFALFRAYGPLKPFFDRSWVLPDIEKVK
jgi:hypothetical protein